MRFVHAVRSADEEQVAHDKGRSCGQVVGEHAEVVVHVHRPDHVAIGRILLLFVLVRPVILSIAEAFGVHCHHFRPVGNVIDHAVNHRRRGANALLGPVVNAPGRELRVSHLPKKFAGLLVKGHYHAAIAAIGLVAHQFVIGAEEYLAVRHHRVPVGLGTDFGPPLDLVHRLDIPSGRNTGLGRDHVARRVAAPHGPVGARCGRCKRARERDGETVAWNWAS